MGAGECNGKVSEAVIKVGMRKTRQKQLAEYNSPNATRRN